MQVYRNIHLIGGVVPDSNVYLIDGEFLVDAGTGHHFSDMKNDIERLCDPSGIRTLVNTHCHYDHIGGNKKFRDWLKLEIAVHSADREAVETGQGSFSELFGQTYRVMTVDKLLTNGSTIRTKNFTFEVISTPGHTPGSICLYEPSKKILISGDTLFYDAMGRTDLGGNAEHMANSLRHISELDVNYLLPGHGAPKIGGVSFLAKQMLRLIPHDAL